MFSGIARQTKSRQFSISRGRGRVSISRVRGSFLGVHLGLGVGLGFGLGPVPDLVDMMYIMHYITHCPRSNGK